MADQDSLPNGLIVYGPDANCTLALCPVEYSVYGYQPTLPGNATILALFAASIFIQLGLGIRYRTWFFMLATIIGSIVEVIGYSGRIMLWQDPFSFSGFLIQIICITLAPVYYAAAIYVTLSQIITTLNPSISRFSPKLYYWLFIPCDIVSLVLQATGGGMSSSSSGISQTAIDVSLAGLAFQVFTITVFVCLAADYGIRYVRSRANGTSSQPESGDRRLMVFVSFISLAVLTLWIRCCYRIFELSGGYQGSNVRNEADFIALESAMILVTCFSLVVAHPGLAFPKQQHVQSKA